MENSNLYLNVLQNGVTTYTTMILQNLNQEGRYFLNISLGALIVKGISINIYSDNQKLLNSTYIPQSQLGLHSLNGYLSKAKLGSGTLAIAIPQAFTVSLHSDNGITSFYNVSKTVLKNGFYYNNTGNLYQIIYNAPNQLYSIIYCYFVWSYSNPPPPNIPAIMWYWPSGNTPLSMTYIYSTGQNTYVIA